MQCQHCEVAEAKVEVEIPMPENGDTKILHLCIDCAVDASSAEIEIKQNGGTSETSTGTNREKSPQA